MRECVPYVGDDDQADDLLKSCAELKGWLQAEVDQAAENDEEDSGDDEEGDTDNSASDEMKIQSNENVVCDEEAEQW